MSIFSEKEEILEGNAGGGKTEKIRELVRKRAPRYIWLVDGKWEPANQRVLQLASAATLDVKYIREDLAAQDLLYKLARHIRNTDEIHPATWGAQGLDLLAQLREIDPERYDKEVK